MKLPQPNYRGSVSLEAVILKRRSVRDFSDVPVSTEDLSQILWAAQGVTDGYFRTAPSAGALYPIEVYVVMGAGVYRYMPDGHFIEQIKSGDLRLELASAALGQGFIADAPLILVIAAVFERTASKYGERGARYVYAEAGHVAQNVCLQATALGLSTVPVGAFYDKKLQLALGLLADHRPIYIMPIGCR